VAVPAAEVERFTIKNLKIGDGPAKIEEFVKANRLVPIRASRSSIRSSDRIREEIYTDKQTYGVGSTHPNALQVELELTPPFFTKDGFGSAVCGIYYETHFGDGVSHNEIKSDLERRWGPVSEGSGAFLRWWIGGSGDVRSPATATAKLTAPENTGMPGKLALWVKDSRFWASARDAAVAHIDRQEAARQKDMTKPDF
jgi:hypothetical protein